MVFPVVKGSKYNNTQALMGRILMLEYAGNTLQSWLVFLGIIVAGFVLPGYLGNLTTRLAYRIIRRQAKQLAESHGSSGTDDVLVSEVAPRHSVMLFYNQMRQPAEAAFTWLFLYVAFNFLDWPPAWVEACRKHVDLPAMGIFLFRVGLVWVGTFSALRLLTYTVESLSSNDQKRVPPQAIMFMREAGRITIYLVALLIFLGYTLGRDVGAIVGGLGISGLAIAFAAKETIENLIASVIIFLD